MGDEFIKLPSGVILNTSCIEGLMVIEEQIGEFTDTVTYKKYLKIRTQSGNVYREDVNFLNTMLQYICVVNMKSEE